MNLSELMPSVLQIRMLLLGWLTWQWQMLLRYGGVMVGCLPVVCPIIIRTKGLIAHPLHWSFHLAGQIHGVIVARHQLNDDKVIEGGQRRGANHFVVKTWVTTRIRRGDTKGRKMSSNSD